MNSRVLGVALAGLLIVSHAASAKQPFEQIDRRDFPVAPNVAITLHVAEGTVHVYGSSENVIKMTAIKKAYTKERLDAIKVDASVNGDTATIETMFPPKPTGLTTADRSGTVDYILLVPQTCTLQDIAVESGEIIIDGLRGSGINTRLTNGRILTLNCFAPGNISLGRGGIDLGYWWWDTPPFTTNASATNGDIVVSLPPYASARIDAATQDGSIRNEFTRDDGENADTRTRQWTIGGNATGEFKLRAINGNIRVRRSY